MMNTKNEEVLRLFEATKGNVQGNGAVKKYSADVEYENLKTGNVYRFFDIDVFSGIDYAYGGHKLAVAELQDKVDAFSQVSTNFGNWSFSKELLTVKEADGSGNKGDYIMRLK